MSDHWPFSDEIARRFDVPARMLAGIATLPHWTTGVAFTDCRALCHCGDGLFLMGGQHAEHVVDWFMAQHRACRPNG